MTTLKTRSHDFELLYDDRFGGLASTSLPHDFSSVGEGKLKTVSHDFDRVDDGTLTFQVDATGIRMRTTMHSFEHVGEGKLKTASHDFDSID